MFNSVLKRAMPVIFWLAGLFVVGACLLMLGATSKQMGKDRDYEAKLRPSIEWVESFQRQNNRLPTDAEFAPRHEVGVDLIQSDSADAGFKAHGGGNNKGDFAVRVWRGEQWTYYFSWSKEFDIVEP